MFIQSVAKPSVEKPNRWFVEKVDIFLDFVWWWCLEIVANIYLSIRGRILGMILNEVMLVLEEMRLSRYLMLLSLEQ